MNRLVREQLGVEGVLVLQVTSGSAAEAAGLRGSEVDAQGNLVPGDIILAVAGKSTDSVAALLSVRDDHRAGEQVSVRVWRSGREAEFPVILEPGG